MDFTKTPPLAVPLPAGTSVPTWTSSDPGVVVSPAPDGLSAIVSHATPPVLVTGVIVSASATLPNGTVITGKSQPIDIVASVDLPTGFGISLT